MPTRPDASTRAKTPHGATSAPAVAAAAKTAAKTAVKTAAKAAASGPQKAMHKLGLQRDIDLVLHLPLRYIDETQLVPIAELPDGEPAQVQGTVRNCHVEQRSRRQLVVRIADASGELTLRFLNFYASQQKNWSPPARLRVRGEARGGFFGREMLHPEVRVVQADTPLPQALTPVYPASAQLPQAYLRKAIASALQRVRLAELLPEGTAPAGLPALQEAVRTLHHPPPGTPFVQLDERRHPAWQRLKFDELLAQQLSQLQAHAARAQRHAPVLRAARDGLATQLRRVLPFELTRAQMRVVAEIEADLARGTPMHRLLQGDVGSGKTVVAALAAAVAIDAGWQCALMAPTEILAEQHFRKLVQWLEPLGLRVAWLSGSRKGRTRAAMLAQVQSGQAMLVVGTHAVIQDDVVFERLGLAVVDEQHRFGVAQRLALRHKLEGGAQAGRESGSADAPLEPHLLMMSATPIPRTLAMSYFADLAVSTIDELPPGRTPIVTKLFADSKRDQVIARIRDEVRAGRQIYWVCPLVEESEHVDLQNATTTHAELSTVLATALPGTMVGLLHGRMPAAEKAAVMSLFTGGQMALLVATTVIEVGVDVPNASLMVVEHAERFGLAQLHQLRGRVGRGAAASVCVLLYSTPLSPTAKARLKAMSDTNDGFEIARRDLEIRGPGEFMGARQSGDALLRFADLAQDTPLLERARAAAPVLLREQPAAAQAHVERWLAHKAEYLKA
jgi:ATP-dependent DNA helicase RecG